MGAMLEMTPSLASNAFAVAFSHLSKAWDFASHIPQGYFQGGRESIFGEWADNSIPAQKKGPPP